MLGCITFSAQHQHRSHLIPKKNNFPVTSIRYFILNFEGKYYASIMKGDSICLIYLTFLRNWIEYQTFAEKFWSDDCNTECQLSCDKCDEWRRDNFLHRWLHNMPAPSRNVMAPLTSHPRLCVYLLLLNNWLFIGGRIAILPRIDWLKWSLICFSFIPTAKKGNVSIRILCVSKMIKEHVLKA